MVKKKSGMSENRDERPAGIARHAAINLIGGAFAPAASFASGPILAHALSVDGRGELAAATMPLALTVTAATIGLPEAVTHFAAQDKRRTKTLFRRGSLLILFPAAIATALMLIASSWISAGNQEVRDLIIISAAFLAPSLLLAVARAVAAAHNRWTAITIERVTTALTRLIPLIILFSTGNLNLEAAAIVTMASTIAGAVAYIPLLTLRRGSLSHRTFSNKTLLSYGGGIWLGSIAGVILMRIDQVLLSPLSSAFELGLYAVAVAISELPLIVNRAIQETAFTHLSSRDADTREIGSLSRTSTIIVLTSCLSVAAVSPFAVPLLFGAEFSGSVSVLLVLLLAVTIGNPGSIAGIGLTSSGYPQLRSYSLIVACLINIGLLALLAPHFGAMGAAIATLAGNAISANMNIVWMIAKRDATLGDFYCFRRADFVKIWQLLRRALRAASRKIGRGRNG